MTDLPVLEPDAAYALWVGSYPPIAHNPMMRAEERAMLSLLPADLSGQDVLDAGCGSGRYLLHALRRGAQTALGIDFSMPMLCRARQEMLPTSAAERLVPTRKGLIRASLEALPLRDQSVDIAVCALALGHVPNLRPPLAELRRLLRPGGTLLCSDFHPIGETLGWPRDFKAEGRRYAVRYTAHTLSSWQTAGAQVGLTVRRVVEPYLDPADISSGATFDPACLDVPVALVFEFQREE